MRFDDYEKAAAKTDIYPNDQKQIAYALGLCSESGEYASKIKKFLRGDYDVNIVSLAYELGDILWYVARAANQIGYNLDEIAGMNIHKLQQRHQRGAIKGDGDSR